MASTGRSAENDESDGTGRANRFPDVCGAPWPRTVGECENSYRHSTSIQVNPVQVNRIAAEMPKLLAASITFSRSHSISRKIVKEIDSNSLLYLRLPLVLQGGF
jgi:hypothetical protein